MKFHMFFEPVRTGTYNGNTYYEQTIVRVRPEGDKREPYPSFMCHIDTFYGEDNLYHELQQGNRVKAVCEIEVLNER